MKIKQYLVITEPDDFFAGNYDRCFNLFAKPPTVPEWTNVCEIEIEVPEYLIEQSKSAAIEKLEKSEQYFKSEMMRVEEAKKKLMSDSDQVAV